jgi:glutathione-regulated potassium-efflux system ancillary protein KefC/glutathione-regulated potassium-efflux system protein KefB
MSLLQEAFVFLAAGVVAVPIASRLGLGSVLGYLIAGVAIGPYALGLVGNAEHIMHFAEFGVVMMLFLIGLELQPNVLWQLRKPILGMGGLQVIVTSLAIAAIAVISGLTWQVGLAIGLILSLSSTAIALQILGEKNLMQTEGGKASFAVLLFQDIAVIPIIAILPLLSSQGTEPIKTDTANGQLLDSLPDWQQALVVIGVILALIVIMRYLMRPVFRFIAQSHLREMFTAVALLLVVGTALLMNMVGLSPALGAFIAGVVLANNEYRHELEANIDPFKALLLGLFFMSVGASIDFSLLMQHPVIVSLVVLGLIIVKFMILWGLAKLFGIQGGYRYWFAFALAQGGEFGFVLLSFSLQNHVLSSDLVDILTAAIALSMVLTPVLILVNERLVQPLFEQGEEEPSEETMDEQHNPVIVAGFGRFGQIVTRLLIANGVAVTVLDHSATHIERVRRFGFKIFYGDASRDDLLHTAGAAKAKLLVIAVDDRATINKIVETAKHNFPNLQIYVRAYDVVHYHELQRLGVDYIERELFLGSLHMGEMVLQSLGMRAYQARRKAQQFAKHDRQTTERLSNFELGSKKYISISQQAREEVLELLQADRVNRDEQEPDNAWNASER